MSKARKISLTSDLLHELFRYEPESGKLFWGISSNNTINIGQEAGSLTAKGYRGVKINERSYQAHRLIWIMAHGEIREDLQIDHINGVRDDNRIENLRLVTNQQNQFNTRAKGYSWNTVVKKWLVRIGIDGGRKHIGYYDTEEEARTAYLEAKKKYHKI